MKVKFGDIQLEIDEPKVKSSVLNLSNEIISLRELSGRKYLSPMDISLNKYPSIAVGKKDRLVISDILGRFNYIACDAVCSWSSSESLTFQLSGEPETKESSRLIVNGPMFTPQQDDRIE